MLPRGPWQADIYQGKHVIGAGIAGEIPKSLVEPAVAVGGEHALRVLKGTGQIRNLRAAGPLPLRTGIIYRMVKDEDDPFFKIEIL